MQSERGRGLRGTAASDEPIKRRRVFVAHFVFLLRPALRSRWFVSRSESPNPDERAVFLQNRLHRPRRRRQKSFGSPSRVQNNSCALLGFIEPLPHRRTPRRKTRRLPRWTTYARRRRRRSRNSTRSPHHENGVEAHTKLADDRGTVSVLRNTRGSALQAGGNSNCASCVISELLYERARPRDMPMPGWRSDLLVFASESVMENTPRSSSVRMAISSVPGSSPRAKKSCRTSPARRWRWTRARARTPPCPCTESLSRCRAAGASPPGTRASRARRRPTRRTRARQSPAVARRREGVPVVRSSGRDRTTSTDESRRRSAPPIERAVRACSIARSVARTRTGDGGLRARLKNRALGRPQRPERAARRAREPHGCAGVLSGTAPEKCRERRRRRPKPSGDVTSYCFSETEISRNRFRHQRNVRRTSKRTFALDRRVPVCATRYRRTLMSIENRKIKSSTRRQRRRYRLDSHTRVCVRSAWQSVRRPSRRMRPFGGEFFFFFGLRRETFGV